MAKVKVFDYDALEKELGKFPRWKKFDGMECKFRRRENNYIIIGTEKPVRIVERQWVKVIEIDEEGER